MCGAEEVSWWKSGGVALKMPSVANEATERFCTCEERDYKGLHSFSSNITRDDPPITRDYPSLPSNITREVTHRTAAAEPRLSQPCEGEACGVAVDRVAERIATLPAAGEVE